MLEVVHLLRKYFGSRRAISEVDLYPSLQLVERLDEQIIQPIKSAVLFGI